MDAFRFAYLEHEFRPRSLWMSVRKELEVASSLLTLAFADLNFQTSVRVGVSDASKWGWAIRYLHARNVALHVCFVHLSALGREVQQQSVGMTHEIC